jgi:hypothetical protein
MDGGQTCGLRLTVLEYAPYLPKGWSSASFKMAVKPAAISVSTSSVLSEEQARLP